jgi:glutamate dehydrogenase
MYIEVDRADARERRELVADLHRVLADVRAAVTDWRAMQARMRADASRCDDPEAAQLLRWFADGAMTLLGFHVENARRGDQRRARPLPPPRRSRPTKAGRSARCAISSAAAPCRCSPRPDRRSTVHRRSRSTSSVCCRSAKAKGSPASGSYAGLWTSEALNQPADQVPLLRRRLASSRRSSVRSQGPQRQGAPATRWRSPARLLISLQPGEVRELVMTAMSLADRPRPTLLLVRSVLKGHLFAFVWLPRDELTTRRRLASAR